MNYLYHPNDQSILIVDIGFQIVNYRFINGVLFTCLEFGRRNDMGHSGLYGHVFWSTDRHQRTTGGARRLFQWHERHGLGARAVRLHRRHGAAYRSQAASIAQVAAVHR